MSTPIETNHKLSFKDGEQLNELVGKLIYLTLIRPDIIYAINIVSQFMHAPTDIHMRTTEILLP